ncbi:MAG: aminoglycoside 6-adenylyltransferase [Tissierellales bacterium]|nr:aminoglycoside 6-adenylyltransferase [Tissierellales bacterium]
MRSENAIMSEFMKWANSNESVRMAILTSSRAAKKCELDFLSDYDIELYVSDIGVFMSDEWLNVFGDVMVRWPYKPRCTGDEGWITRLVLFDDGVRIDFQITDNRNIEFERYKNGYKVLLDKDNRTMDIPDATYDEFIIKKPTREEYETVVNEFWWNVYYVPKYLWRDQLPFSKFMLDNILRYEYLHTVVDWYIGLEHDWKIETGALGKKYKEILSADDWSEFETTYVGGGIDENWKALKRLTSLFRRLGKKISDELGYEYPDEVDRKVMIFCEKIMDTEKLKN